MYALGSLYSSFPNTFRSQKCAFKLKRTNTDGQYDRCNAHEIRIWRNYRKLRRTPLLLLSSFLSFAFSSTSTTKMSLFFANSDTPQPDPISGAAYLSKLHKFLKSNAARLAPSAPRNTSRNLTPSIWQQGYTVLTLGLDPNSAPIRNTKGPISLGFGMPSTKRTPPPKPLLLRLPPDRLLYLLLRWQALPQSLPHVGRTDTPIEEGVVIAARGMEGESRGKEGDVRSVRSWVGSIRSVSGTLVGGGQNGGWWGSKQTVNEGKLVLCTYEQC